MENYLILAGRYAAPQEAFAVQEQAITVAVKEEDKIEDPSKEISTNNKSTTSTGRKIQGKLEKEDNGYHTPCDEKAKDRTMETKKDKDIEKKEIDKESVEVDIQLN